MSVKVLDAVFRSDLAGASRRAVLLALADNAKDTGLCYPSVMTLARKTGLSRATVFRSLNDLEREGVLRRGRRRRGNGAWSSNGYWIQLDVLAARDRARLQAQVEIDKLEVLFGIEPATDPTDTADAAAVADTAIDTAIDTVAAAVDLAVAGGLPGGLDGPSGTGLDGHATDLPEPVFPQLTPPSHSDTPPVSPCDPTGVSPPVTLNRQRTVTGEPARASAPATDPDPDRSSTARPDPEPVGPGDAPQELSTPTAEPRADEPTTTSAEEPMITAAAPVVSDLVTTAARQAQLPPAPVALVPDPARRETWRCPRHLATPDPHDRPCGGCGAVRKRMQAQEDHRAATAAQQRAQAAQHARQKIADCPECDDHGHVIDHDTDGPCYPVLVCDHQTPAATRVARQTQRLAAQTALTQQTYQRSPDTLALLAQVRAGLPQRDLRRARRNPKAWK